MKKITFIDLFSGIGGFHIALKSVGGECVSACEIDKNARITYEYNFNHGDCNFFDNGFFFEDITKLKGNEFPDHDILCGGFPCQAFSIAGYRKGFEDERGNLFFDVARILKKKRPKVVFLENVKNLKSHDHGKTLATILDTLEHLGYYVKYDILNTYEYGDLPQNRERIYIVGFLNKYSYERFSFPEKIPLTKTIKDIIEDETDKNYFYEGKNLYVKIKDVVTNENSVYQWRRQYVRENKKGIFPTLTANMGTGGHNVPIVITQRGIRKITPRECLKIQGFPLNYKLPSISNGQLYKQIGNSVSVPVLQRICENILKAM
ncbi:MAG: DNA cytosine methyltransferase [Candidatus Altimarinota bacterium]